METNTKQLSQEHINFVMALYSSGKIQETIDTIKILDKNYPNVPLFFNILGACYKHLNKLEESTKMFEIATEIKPDYYIVHNNLGINLLQLGKLDAATDRFKKAIAIKPDYIDAHYNLCITIVKLGRLEEAVICYEKAITIKPDFVEAHNNLGSVFKQLGQLEEAARCYDKAIAIKPNFIEAHYNLGSVYEKLCQLDKSMKCYEKAIAIKPDYVEAHNNLGSVYEKLCQPNQAMKCYEKAIAIKPDFVEAHNNLGNVFNELGKPNQAIKCYEKGIAINPNDSNTYNNLGNVFSKLHNYKSTAGKFYEHALSINPNSLAINRNAAYIMEVIGKNDKALFYYERVYAIEPNTNFTLGHIFINKMHLCIWDNFSVCFNKLIKKINNNERVISPFSLMVLIDDPELHKKNTKIYVNYKYPKNNELSKIKPYPKHSKIRIGYFSPDFKAHPVSFLTAELYEIHDRNRFEIYAFSLVPDTKDEMNLRIKDGVDYFYNVHTMSHKEIARFTRSLKIDIAVDLVGFTKNNRTEIFAIGVAPIQINYLGYPGTMGDDYYDYLIADQTIIPKKNQKFYSEKIVYLPCYQVNDSKQIIPDIKFTRETLGLPLEGFVFCCFNNTYKITPTFFDSWTRILKSVKDSILFIYVKNDSAKINLTKEIIARDIDPSRLIFAEYLPRQEHIARYKIVDLFLDTSPYNAHTTASDALRMGVPVLTCIGKSFASREGASILNAVNLPELITTTQEEYESLAIELATDPEKLNSIKNKLVSNLPTAPLYNTALFTKHLESAYTTMYDRYHKGLEPDHIYVQNIV